MSKPRDDRQKDLLLPALAQIIDMGHTLVRLAALIDWKFLDDRFGSVCQTGPGQPGLPTRLVAGLFILKHKSVGGAQDWRHRSQGPGASGGRYHGAAKGR